MLGTTSPCAAAPQSGWERTPAAMYATKRAEQQDALDPVEPASTSAETASRGQRHADVTTYPHARWPPRRRQTRRTGCRVGDDEGSEHGGAPAAVPLADQPGIPLPVTTPMRAPSSWKKISARVERANTQSSW